jgi:hypothetical protein
MVFPLVDTFKNDFRISTDDFRISTDNEKGEPQTKRRALGVSPGVSHSRGKHGETEESISAKPPTLAGSRVILPRFLHLP